MQVKSTKPPRALPRFSDCNECGGSGEIEFFVNDVNSSVSGYTEVGECPTCARRQDFEDFPVPARS